MPFNISYVLLKFKQMIILIKDERNAYVFLYFILFFSFSSKHFLFLSSYFFFYIYCVSVCIFLSPFIRCIFFLHRFVIYSTSFVWVEEFYCCWRFHLFSKVFTSFGFFFILPLICAVSFCMLQMVDSSTYPVNAKKKESKRLSWRTSCNL